jgi:hypothetical protein
MAWRINSQVASNLAVAGCACQNFKSNDLSICSIFPRRSTKFLLIGFYLNSTPISNESFVLALQLQSDFCLSRFPLLRFNLFAA